MFGLPAAAAAPTPESGALPARLQHVVHASTNAERMQRFFCDVVGFRLSDRVVDTSGSMRTCFLRTDHEHHSVAIFQADANGLDHHCYESADWNSIRDCGDHFASMRQVTPDRPVGSWLHEERTLNSWGRGVLRS